MNIFLTTLLSPIIANDLKRIYVPRSWINLKACQTTFKDSFKKAATYLSGKIKNTKEEHSNQTQKQTAKDGENAEWFYTTNRSKF